MLKSFEHKIAHFTFTPTFSRPTEEAQWDGERSRFTNLIEKDIPEGAHIDAFTCSSPVMVQSCVDLLKKKGISDERILYDKFE